jgi:trk system potassium uptake protein TrkA
MHVIVVGCGRVGSELSLRLDRAGHHVVIIDKDYAAFRRLPDGWPGDQVVGFGFDRDHLAEAGIDHCDALAAVTSGDNTNILTARIARETYDVPTVVARIYDPRRAVIYQQLGITTVATVSWTVDQMLQRMFPDPTTTWTDPTGQVSLVERLLPASLAGRPLREIGDSEHWRPVLLTRAGEARLASPEMVGQEGDVVVVAVKKEAMAELETLIGYGVPSRDTAAPQIGARPRATKLPPGATSLRREESR